MLTKTTRNIPKFVSSAFGRDDGGICHGAKLKIKTTHYRRRIRDVRIRSLLFAFGERRVTAGGGRPFAGYRIK